MTIKTSRILFIVLLIITASLLPLAASAEVLHYYQIDLHYSFGNVTPAAVTVQPSPSPLSTPAGQYLAEVVSSDNQILNVTFFDIPTTVFFDTIDKETGEINGGGQVELNETNVTLYVPYVEDAVEINIYNWSLARMATIDVSEYSELDKDRIGDTAAGEERSSPPLEKCVGKPGQKCGGEPGESTRPSITTYGLALIGLILLVLIIVIIRIALKNKKE
ncbi:hypothetical protein HYU19_02585 [Candidatus Woesearchaeota archaeon]|nr:hypothetical protein [Candidatus Woesearchaeota archaeon]